jgi:hypothetical protein
MRAVIRIVTITGLGAVLMLCSGQAPPPPTATAAEVQAAAQCVATCDARYQKCMQTGYSPIWGSCPDIGVPACCMNIHDGCLRTCPKKRMRRERAK